MGLNRCSYLFWDLVLVILWLFFFLSRKDLRRQMSLISLLTTPSGPIAELWYLKDYWQPDFLLGGPINIEDLLFGFTIGGIATVLYKVLLKRKLVKDRARNLWLLPLVILVEIICMIVLTDILKVNSIYGSCLGFVINGFVILYKRRDLAACAFVSGLFLSLTMFVLYYLAILWCPGIVKAYWLLHGTAHGILFCHVPVAELLWSFTCGMVGGTFFEFWQGYRLMKITSRIR